ncbi:MAG: flagellar filament capping protein FliD [bacterium]|nr:flagellar filament capping protein FliD [bacterium]
MATIPSLNSLSNFDSYFKTVTHREQTSIDKLKTNKTALNRKNAVLSDLRTKLNTLRTRLKGFTTIGAEAKLAANKTASSDESIFTAVADSSAITATHTVNIENIAKNDILVSDVLQDRKSDVSKGKKSSRQEFTVQVGSNDAVSISIKIGSEDTNETVLDNIAEQINLSADDVSATVVSNTRTKSRLVLTSNNPGSEYNITLSDTGSSNLIDTLGLSGSSRSSSSNTKGGYITEDAEELDAQLTVNGIEITSSDNSITDVISGVTINLRKSSSGDETLTVSNDSDAIKEQVGSFITEYNDVLSYVNTKTSVNAVSKTRGDLAGNFSFRNLKIDLRTQVSEEVSGIDSDSISQIRSIGISTGSSGALTLDDEDALEEAIASDAESVIDLFSSNFGIATKLIDTIESFTLTGKTIDRNISLVNNQIDNVNSRESSLNKRLQSRENNLKKKFSDLEKTLALLTSQQSMLQRFGLSFQSIFQTRSNQNTGFNLFGY